MEKDVKEGLLIVVGTILGIILFGFFMYGIVGFTDWLMTDPLNILSNPIT